MTERYNRTLKNVLSHLASQDRGTWDESLQWATLAINTSYQSTIEEIPFFLFHGRDADIPLVKLMQTPQIDYSLGENYAAEVTMRLHQAFKTVKEKSETAHQKSALLREKGVRNDHVAPGAVVLLRNETNQPDEAASWPTLYEGPYRVMEKNVTNTKIVGICDRKEKYVHLNRLKIAHLRGDPFPLTEAVTTEEVNKDTTDTEQPIPEEEASGDNQTDTIGPRYNLRHRRN
jgi:hypothetical protein